MDLHFHVHHSGDAARIYGDTPILCSGSGQLPAVYMNPNRIRFLTALIWDSLRQACRRPNGIRALDNNGVTMSMFLLVPRYLPLWVDFRQQP